MLTIYLLVVSLFGGVALSTSDGTVCYTPARPISLDYGTFVGSYNDSSGIIAYRGVPYADPPVGDLRWREPVTPPTSQLGTVNAFEFGPQCIATKRANASIPITQSEDCLHGNIYVPSWTNATNLPVLVYYHGGGFQSGSSRTAPPEWLMASSKMPFIFVTFNYRLGQFGFLGGAALGADGVANAGLFDQRASLKWVQRYISSFGGDPSRVTIWGQSAGSAMVMLQLIANGGDNEGLFSQAMGDSPALSSMPRYNDTVPDEVFRRFASLAGCEVLSPSANTDLMPCLRNASVEALIYAGNATAIAYSGLTIFRFTPLVDGKLIIERPVEAFRSGNFVKVPMFFGSNTHEGKGWAERLTDPIGNTTRTGADAYTVYSFINGQYGGFTTSTFLNATALYPPVSKGGVNSSYNLLAQEMYGDMRFICTAGLITGSAAQHNITSYQYHYDNPWLGDMHHYELQAMFSTEETDTYQRMEDTSLFEDMRLYWTSFATQGKPLGSDTRNVNWLPSQDVSGGPRLLLNPTRVMMEDIDAESLGRRCTMWHNQHEELST
ncbi:alpha/beta-hydrolase [Cylindrobasidium torrendii FP15055 ss-10]|uniref:Carboxylic ester hydrolase n=1 Tax=Cylindrobasidium torrendii FP15055 ss-10 TaxID=1314674 RepID=A0A0D7BV80_9AGAR|nr:alpha/beta-hydrolase [Cylindrobasidium torrendii FP15055 ss-10]